MITTDSIHRRDALAAAIRALPHPPLPAGLRRQLLAAAPVQRRRQTLAWPRLIAAAAAAALAVGMLPLAIPTAVPPPALMARVAPPSAPAPVTDPSVLAAWPVSVIRSATIELELSTPQASVIGGLVVEGLDVQGKVVLCRPALGPGMAPAALVVPGERWRVDLGQAEGVVSVRLRRGSEVAPAMAVPAPAPAP